MQIDVGFVTRFQLNIKNPVLSSKAMRIQFPSYNTSEHLNKCNMAFNTSVHTIHHENKMLEKERKALIF